MAKPPKYMCPTALKILFAEKRSGASDSTMGDWAHLSQYENAGKIYIPSSGYIAYGAGWSSYTKFFPESGTPSGPDVMSASWNALCIDMGVSNATEDNLIIQYRFTLSNGTIILLTKRYTQTCQYTITHGTNVISSPSTPVRYNANRHISFAFCVDINNSGTDKTFLHGLYAFNEYNEVTVAYQQYASQYDTYFGKSDFEGLPGPYDPGGTSEEGGGDGDFDDTSDPIPVPDDPTISAASSGLVTIYNPTLQQMRDVADALLNPNILTALANNVVKLSDVIIGLSIFPMAIPDGGSEYIKINLLGFQWNTNVSCTKAASQFITLDCGKISLNEYWGSCLDYSPFTQVGIFLPYCGYFPLNVDEVMGHDIGVIYKVDLFSGQCIAFITVDGSVHYQFTGSCSTQIPISSQSYDGLMSALLEFAGATAEFAGALGERGAQRDRINAGEGIFSPTDADRANAVQMAMDKRVDQTSTNLVSATLGAVMGCKPNYARTGMIHGPAGFMGVQKPYINIIRPRQSLPVDYQSYEGFPSNITETLGNLSGYTKVESIKLSIPEATALEKEAIVTLLQGGVIL